MPPILNRCPPPFQRSEFEQRLSRVRRAMEAAGLDRLLVGGAAQIAWLTGYDADSDYVPQLVVVDQEVEATLFLREMDLAGAMHMSWLSPARMIGYPESHVGGERDGYDFILDQLRGSGRGTGRIGAPLGRWSETVAQRIRAGLPDAQLIAADDLIDWLRITKSPAEQAVMREAGRITDHAMAVAYATIAPGTPEPVAAAAVCSALILGPDGLVGDRIISPLMPADTRTGSAHLGWSEQRYGATGSVNLELGASRYGYCTGLMRTISLGAPSEKLLRLHEGSLAGRDAALSAARPGATCAEVAEAFTAVAARSGVSKASRCGYPIGLHWMEPTASLQPGDLTELAPGMTFHLMLGNWASIDFGYVLSETFLVTDAGAERLTLTAPELCIVG